jgi:hypothetical protein
MLPKLLPLSSSLSNSLPHHQYTMADIDVEAVLKKLTVAEKVDLLAGMRFLSPLLGG